MENCCDAWTGIEFELNNLRFEFAALAGITAAAAVETASNDDEKDEPGHSTDDDNDVSTSSVLHRHTDMQIYIGLHLSVVI